MRIAPSRRRRFAAECGNARFGFEIEHMRRSKRWASVVSLFALALGVGADARASGTRSRHFSETSGADGKAVSARLTSLPLRFEPNEGQSDPRVAFLARTPAYDIFLTKDGATLGFRAESKEDCASSSSIRMRVVGGRAVEPLASEGLPGTSNYLMGSDPAKWRTGIGGYARVRYPDVLPGIDVVYYGTGTVIASDAQRLEYDVVLAPGVDPKSAVLAFDGAESIAIDASGTAVLKLHGGREVVQPAPLAYQVDASGKRRPVDVRYVRREGGIGFAVGGIDARRALVIDPALVYSTYLGGLASDGAYGVALDGAGEAFIAGTTASSNFPDASLPQSTAGGGYDAFVTKLNAAGSAIVYSTYLGGSGSDFANGIVVDSAGEAFVTGTTSSTNFPTASALRATYAGGAFDGFVTKLNAAGSAFVYSTYVGGSANDQSEGIAIDSAGEAFVAGFTFSTNFPTVSALQSANHATSGTAFVAKLNAAGSAFVYSTYLGGSTQDNANDIAIDSAGEAFVAGTTSSSNFPLLAPLQGTYGGGMDGFVAKLNAAGSALVYSTYLGGSAADSANSVAVDGAGEAFVTGNTASSDFPTAAPVQGALNGPQDAFVAKLNSAGSALAFATYLGGSGQDFGNSIGVDAAGEAFVAGYTFSTDFPTTSAWQSASAGKQDAFVTGFSAAGTALLYSSYLGGSDNEQAYRIAVDPVGEAVVVGETASTDLRMLSAVQATEAGGDDAFVTKIAQPSPIGAAPAPALGDKAVTLLASLLLLCGIALAGRARRVRW